LTSFAKRSRKGSAGQLHDGEKKLRGKTFLEKKKKTKRRKGKKRKKGEREGTERGEGNFRAVKQFLTCRRSINSGKKKGFGN